MLKTARIIHVLAALALVATVLAANSAAATGGPGGLLDDTAPIPADDSGSEGFAVGLGGDDLLAGEDGPIATTGALTYEMAWAPGASAPHNLGGIGADDGVTVATGAVGEDGTFVVLLVIDSDDDPTEYRFDNSVPEGHTAELQLDGSVQLIDADGNEAGIIATPWALDATGAEIPTSFALDGSTLVQTVNHQGATYPVIADPCGWSWRGALDCLTVAAAAAPGSTCLCTADCYCDMRRSCRYRNVYVCQYSTPAIATTATTD